MSTVAPRGLASETVLRDSAPVPNPRGLSPADTLPELSERELKSRFGCALIDHAGREIPITEAMIHQALLALDGLTCRSSANPSATSVRR